MEIRKTKRTSNLKLGVARANQVFEKIQLGFVYILRTCQGGKFVVVLCTHVYRGASATDEVPATLHDNVPSFPPYINY
jgi:hypothetical protein